MNSTAVDELRLEANKLLDPARKSELGQFMTPSNIAFFNVHHKVKSTGFSCDCLGMTHVMECKLPTLQGGVGQAPSMMAENRNPLPGWGGDGLILAIFTPIPLLTSPLKGEE